MMYECDQNNPRIKGDGIDRNLEQPQYIIYTLAKMMGLEDTEIKQMTV